jgi:type III secretory pathway component EscV
MKPDISQCGELMHACIHCHKVQPLPDLHQRICQDAQRIKELREALHWLAVVAVRAHNTKLLPEDIANALQANVDRAREVGTEYAS